MIINDITEISIGACIEVHRNLGPGLLESIYEACVFHELAQRGIYVERQKEMPIVYKRTKLDCGYRLDLVVERQVILEIKCVDRFDPVHTAQVLTYLKLSGYPIGLLINFKVPLLTQGIKRIAGPNAPDSPLIR
jgi:GxxExxY protein